LQQSPPGFARVEIAPTHSDKHDPEPATSTAPPAPDVPEMVGRIRTGR
jgi:hypothetical protein